MSSTWLDAAWIDEVVARRGAPSALRPSAPSIEDPPLVPGLPDGAPATATSAGEEFRDLGAPVEAASDSRRTPQRISGTVTGGVGPASGVGTGGGAAQGPDLSWLHTQLPLPSAASWGPVAAHEPAPARSAPRLLPRPAPAAPAPSPTPAPRPAPVTPGHHPGGPPGSGAPPRVLSAPSRHSPVARPAPEAPAPVAPARPAGARLALRTVPVVPSVAPAPRPPRPVRRAELGLGLVALVCLARLGLAWSDAQPVRELRRSLAPVVAASTGWGVEQTMISTQTGTFQGPAGPAPALLLVEMHAGADPSDPTVLCRLALGGPVAAWGEVAPAAALAPVCQRVLAPPPAMEALRLPGQRLPEAPRPGAPPAAPGPSAPAPHPSAARLAR